MVGHICRIVVVAMVIQVDPLGNHPFHSFEEVVQFIHMVVELGFHKHHIAWIVKVEWGFHKHQHFVMAPIDMRNLDFGWDIVGK